MPLSMATGYEKTDHIEAAIREGIPVVFSTGFPWNLIPTGL